MGQVNSHTQVVHAVDHGDAEIAEPAVVALVLAVADVVLSVIG
jgi:hypothetical protein